MTAIKVITYAESREAFFEKELKRAQRKLDNVVKYGTDPDACAEKGEIVSFYQDVLSALREKAERSRGCPWCKAEYTIIDDDFGQPVHPNMIKFCWHCGRALKGGE